MIQRIQSIFLFVCALSFILLFEFPFAISESAFSSQASKNNLFANSVYDVNDHPILVVLSVLGGLLSIIAIFMYKRRLSQMRMGYLIAVLSILSLVVIYVFYLNESSLMPDDVEIADDYGMYLPMIAFIFSILANYFIRKDEKLVRSMDRLR